MRTMLFSPPMVLKEFKVNPAEEEKVCIVARKAGFFAWLFSLFGIDPTVTFKVFKDHLKFRTGSLNGQIDTILPHSSVSIAQCGYTRPFMMLVMAMLFFFIGILALLYALYLSLMSKYDYYTQCILPVGVFVIMMFLGLIFSVIYESNKALAVTIVSHSGWSMAVCFKPSVIGGVSVDYEQVRKVIYIINDCILEQNAK